MKKLYEKSEIGFALVWVGLYVGVMNVALRFCGGFDRLETKTVGQLLVPVACILLLAALSTGWILSSGLARKYGLCSFRGKPKAFLWFIPMIVLSCTNLKNGLTLTAPAAVAGLMAVNMAAAGYVEELIFRGFLFRAMEKDSLKTAVTVSAVTFGAGHIVNLGNTADTAGVLMQVCYAIAIGFLFTVTVYKGGSLWPCVASHMVVNGTSVFAREDGAFTQLVETLFRGKVSSDLFSAVLIILLSGGYALWLWKKTESPES